MIQKLELCLQAVLISLNIKFGITQISVFKIDVKSSLYQLLLADHYSMNISWHQNK